MSPYGASSIRAARSTASRRRRAGFRRARRPGRRGPAGGGSGNGSCHDEILCFGRELAARRWPYAPAGGVERPRTASRRGRGGGVCVRAVMGPTERSAAGRGHQQLCGEEQVPALVFRRVRPRPSRSGTDGGRPRRRQGWLRLPAAAPPLRITPACAVINRRRASREKPPGSAADFTPTSGTAGGACLHPGHGRRRSTALRKRASRGGRQRPWAHAIRVPWPSLRG